MVAWGTSLPDTLGARTVTRLEKYADGCMVHITGSIAVNVLMGVGMPWLVAAAYHHVQVVVLQIFLLISKINIVVIN